MPNNFYTAPSKYASKQTTKFKIKTKSQFEQGMGYTLPDGVSRQQFKKLYAEWEAKLQNSGFTDIEYRSPSQSGHFSPFFRSNGSTATFMRAYDPAKEEYYRLARHFQAFMNESVEGVTRWSSQFPGKANLYEAIWALHVDGVPYRAVAAAFSGKPNKWLKNIKLPPAHMITGRSVFWAHDNTHRILNAFWAWAKTYETGFDDPRQSE